MATNTRKSSDVLKGGEQPLYQPWDDFSGKPQTRQSEDDIRDNSPIGDNLDNDFNYTSSRSNRTQSATNALRNAENNALKNPSDPSLYTGKGRANSQNVKGKKKKGLGAIITLILIFACGGIFLGASNSLLLPAIAERFTTSTNYQYASFSKRALKLFGFYMDNDPESVVTNGWLGAKKYTNVSDDFKKALALNGIEFEGSGRNKTVSWTHTDNDGNITKRTGISASEFMDLYKNNVNFRDDYSIAVNNRTTGFFDQSAEKTFQHVGNTRNSFKNFEDTGDPEVNQKAYEDTMRPKFDNNNTDVQTTHREDKTELRDTGEVDPETKQPIFEEVTIPENVATPDHAVSSGSTIDASESKARDMIDTVTGKIDAGDVGNWTCTAMRIGNMISQAVAANEMYQSIQFFMSLMEPISKVKAGYGDQSPIHQVLNFFNTSATTTVSDFGTLQVGSGYNSSSSVSGVELTGSPLESNGMQVILANAPVDQKTASLFSRERVNNSLASKLGLNKESAYGCAVFDASNSLVSLSVQLLSGGVSKIFTGITKKLIFGVAQTVAVSAFFSFLVPTLAKVFFTNAFDYAVGKVGGELFASGSATTNSKLAQRSSGMMPGSKSRVAAYNKITNEVLALDAERERNRLSPFDTSSPNTFFGSIAYSLLPTLTSGGINNLSSLLRSTASSLSSLIGGVHAEGEDSSYMTTSGDCDNLEATGADGDMYCIIKPTSDESTADISPTDATYQEKISSQQENCDENGNCSIKAGSELGNFINICVYRDSQFGVLDQNILAMMQPSDGLGLGASVIGVIPIVGDIVSFFDAASDLQNIDWATGEKCINSEENDWWEENGKYFSQYVEDMRILDSNGAFKATDSKNPVLTFHEETEKKYYEEHPEANTYIGYLSRISGLTIENTKTAIAFMQYFDYIDNYDPSLRIAMTGDASKIKNGEQIVAEIQSHDTTLHFEEDQTPSIDLEENVIALHSIIYADLRNRSYAIC